jgi:hypothetical protein
MIRILTLFLTASAAGAFAPSQRGVMRTTTSATTTTPSISSVVLSATSGSTTEYTEQVGKLYTKESKETPKVLGGLKMGGRELVVITGASSGLGLNTAINLAKTGRYYVVMAVRDTEKAKRGT